MKISIAYLLPYQLANIIFMIRFSACYLEYKKYLN